MRGSIMKDTTCGCDCPLVKSGICKSDRECPNFLESWWQEGENGKPTLIKDCAPRRVLIQQGEMRHALIGVQASICELREKISSLISIFANLAQRSTSDAEVIPHLEEIT